MSDSAAPETLLAARGLSEAEQIVVRGMRNGVEYIHRVDFDAALAELRQERAEVARLRQALERVYQEGRGPHVEIARAALND